MNPEQTQQNTGTSVTEKIETLLFYSKDWMKLNMNMKSFSFFAPPLYSLRYTNHRAISLFN
jgi:hypothetical protein